RRKVEELDVPLARGLELFLRLAESAVLDLELDLVDAQLVKEPIALLERVAKLGDLMELRRHLLGSVHLRAHDLVSPLPSRSKNARGLPSPTRGTRAPCARRSAPGCWAGRPRFRNDVPSRRTRSIAPRSRPSPSSPDPSLSRCTPSKVTLPEPRASAA